MSSGIDDDRRVAASRTLRRRGHAPPPPPPRPPRPSRRRRGRRRRRGVDATRAATAHRQRLRQRANVRSLSRCSVGASSACVGRRRRRAASAVSCSRATGAPSRRRRRSVGRRRSRGRRAARPRRDAHAAASVLAAAPQRARRCDAALERTREAPRRRLRDSVVSSSESTAASRAAAPDRPCLVTCEPLLVAARQAFLHRGERSSGPPSGGGGAAHPGHRPGTTKAFALPSRRWRHCIEEPARRRRGDRSQPTCWLLHEGQP